MHRLGICSWSLRPNSPLDLVERMRQAGFSACQLALVPVCEDPAWRDAPRVLRDHGIAVLSGMLATHGEDYSTLESIARTGGLRPTEHWPANRERAQRVAECAEACGIPLVTLHAGFLPHEADDPERAELLGRLREVADVFAARGVGLGLETGQESAATLLDALRDLRHPSVGVNFDPANMILYGMGDPVDAIVRLAQHVVQVHVKDAIPTRSPGSWGSEVAAGQGAVDWRSFFAAVKALPRTVNLLVEREAGAAREGDAAKAAALVRTAFPGIA